MRRILRDRKRSQSRDSKEEKELKANVNMICAALQEIMKSDTLTRKVRFEPPNGRELSGNAPTSRSGEMSGSRPDRSTGYRDQRFHTQSSYPSQLDRMNRDLPNRFRGAMNPPRCWYCHKDGHYANDCRTKQFDLRRRSMHQESQERSWQNQQAIQAPPKPPRRMLPNAPPPNEPKNVNRASPGNR